MNEIFSVFGVAVNFLLTLYRKLLDKFKPYSVRPKLTDRDLEALRKVRRDPVAPLLLRGKGDTLLLTVRELDALLRPKSFFWAGSRKRAHEEIRDRINRGRRRDPDACRQLDRWAKMLREPPIVFMVGSPIEQPRWSVEGTESDPTFRVTVVLR